MHHIRVLQWDRDLDLAWKLYLCGLDGEIPVYAAPEREEDYCNLPPTLTYVGTIEPIYRLFM